jgi:hypothetical protein
MRGFIKQSGISVSIASNVSASTFCDYLDHIKSEIIFRKNTEKKNGLRPTISLSKEDKKSIHGYINGIRELVEASDLSERKKSQLYSILSNLAKEVDLPNTPVDRIFATIWAIDQQIADLKDKSAIGGLVKNIFDIVCKFSPKNLRLTVQTPKLTLVAETVSNDDTDQKTITSE